MEAKNSTKNVTIEATVIRADGTRENLGVISKAKEEPNVKKLLKMIGGIK